MNAELYSIRSSEKELETLNSEIGNISKELQSKNIQVLYKTEVNRDKLKLLQAIKQTFTSRDNIEFIIIANALDNTKDNVIFATLCGLATNKNTSENITLKKLKEQDMPTLIMAYELTPPSEENQIQENETLFSNGVSLGDMGNGYEAYCFFCGNKKIIALPQESLAGTPATQMIKNAVNLALEKAPIEKSLLRTDGIAFSPDTSDLDETPKKKKGFWSGIIPMKGDSGKEITRKVVLILAVLTFLVTAGILLFQMVINPALNNKKNDDLRDIFYSTSDTGDTTNPDTGEIKKETRNWKGLLDINKDVTGWVKIPDTNIDYVVMNGKKDTISYQEYLYKDIYQNYSGYGSIFEDYRSKGGSKSKNIILHGHNMLDGSMFANLMNYGKYTGDLDFYKKHPLVEYDSPDYDGEWEIISVYKTNTLDSHGKFFNYLTGEFASDAEFMNYIYLIRERSLIDTPVKVNEDDQIISLSTCSYEFSEFRTVVVARRLRDGEKKADFTKAQLNPNPLWPDIYYGTYGGSKPTVTSFKNAYKAGQINWYDGAGNLKGKERRFTLDENDYIDDAIEPTTGSATEPVTEPPTEAPVIEEPVTEAVDDTEIWFNYSALTMNVTDKEKLSVVWNPTNTTDTRLIWKTSNANVASITSDGTVTAVGGGSATITAVTKNGNVASCTVTVNKPYIDVSYVGLDYLSYPRYVGETVTLHASVFPSDATDKTIIWSSSNPNVATVNSSGKVTAVGEGTCTIIIMSANGKTAGCTVDVSNRNAPPQQQTTT